jgi:hypothetical protein
MSVARFALIGEAEDVLRLMTIRSTDDKVNPNSGPSGRLAQRCRGKADSQVGDFLKRDPALAAS